MTKMNLGQMHGLLSRIRESWQIFILGHCVKLFEITNSCIGDLQTSDTIIDIHVVGQCLISSQYSRYHTLMQKAVKWEREKKKKNIQDNAFDLESLDGLLLNKIHTNILNFYKIKSFTKTFCTYYQEKETNEWIKRNEKWNESCSILI